LQPRDHRGVLTLRRAADTAAPMSRLRILPVSLAALFLTLGKAHAQYVYIKHPEALVKQGLTTAVLPANPLRAFVYCVIASPGKGEPLAPSVVTMGDAKTGVAVHYLDHPPQLWANTGAV
jgi:hypothetical protein